MGGESEVRDLECPDETRFGANWVFTSNHCPCWGKRMSVCWWLGALVLCWLISECLDSSVAGVVWGFLRIWSWLKRLTSPWLYSFFFFSPFQHFLPRFLEYIEHCFSSTDALTKDEAMAILAKLILVKAEPPTIGSMAFEKYPLIFTESSVRWDFSSLANTRCVCMAAGWKAVQSYIKVASQHLPELCKWQCCWQICKTSDMVGSRFCFWD